ncbi:Hpt domain-containing protein [Paeniroseomonas aquatica]|uniref:Hpt domain-containing protein n=1 Tax=Paeniroseomonas aquatica TaxID=373043 RepID=UPI003616A66B
MSFDHLRATYFEECAELLESAYAQLAALAQGREDADTVHALFRAIHSIKGGGGAFGFGRLVGLAHAMETLLDLLRDGTIAFTPELVTLMLRGTDALADLLAAERDGAAAPPGLEAELTEAFLAAAAGTGAPASPAAAPRLPQRLATPAGGYGSGLIRPCSETPTSHSCWCGSCAAWGR